MRVRIEVNGEPNEFDVEPRVTLADALRGNLGLTGTHVGCEHGVCGACTVLLDGEPTRSCLLFAVQCDGRRLTTVEGLARGDKLSPVQEAFLEHRGFQCGFCTPGFQIAVTAICQQGEPISKAALVDRLASHICRCTGYVAIVDAACSAVEAAGLLHSADAEVPS